MRKRTELRVGEEQSGLGQDICSSLWPIWLLTVGTLCLPSREHDTLHVLPSLCDAYWLLLSFLPPRSVGLPSFLPCSLPSSSPWAAIANHVEQGRVNDMCWLLTILKEGKIQNQVQNVSPPPMLKFKSFLQMCEPSFSTAWDLLHAATYPTISFPSV